MATGTYQTMYLIDIFTHAMHAQPSTVTVPPSHLKLIGIYFTPLYINDQL